MPSPCGWHCRQYGDALTYKLLDVETNKIIHHSIICLTDVLDERNKYLSLDQEERDLDIDKDGISEVIKMKE